ncbi:MAG: aldehyde ferredoxin oxidoreductase C-terminal domain-containing protein [Planctomycetota bacterium]|jgi:aldehyde:ferredoxin oxidoreductase
MPQTQAAPLPPIEVTGRQPDSFTIHRYFVDLSSHSFKHEAVTCHDLEDVFGGIGRGFKVLEGMPKVTDPYDPAAPLIMNLGALSGTSFMTGLRTFFVGYSPLKRSRAGQPSVMWSTGSGKFGTKLRFLEVDEVIFTGRSPTPVFMHLQPGGPGQPAKISFLDATAYVGMPVNQKMQGLAPSFPEAHFAMIGPAGENYANVRYAAVALSTINQLQSGDMKARFCGRGGFGGVLGSKNLIGMIADGPDPKIEMPKELKPVNQEVARGEGSRRFREANAGNGGGGTWANLHGLNPVHGSPEYNFWPSGTDKSVPLYRENVEADGRFIVKAEACFRCGIRCHKNMYEKTEEGKAGRFLAKFDYEPLNLLSSNLGIFDAGEAAELVELVDDLCMDSISIGVTLSYAMEYNRRHPDKEGLAGGLTYGDFQATRQVIEQIGSGQMPELGQGTLRLSEQTGEPEYAMHCKGVEFPAYLPQQNPGYPWALAGGHMSMRTYLLVMYEREVGIDYWVKAITYRGPLILRDDVLGICKFAALKNADMSTAIEALTGMKVNPKDLGRLTRRVFLRGYRLERREGMNDADYSMPDFAHRKNPHTEMPYFNTRAFFKVLRSEVTKRLEEMLEAEGLAI